MIKRAALIFALSAIIPVAFAQDNKESLNPKERALTMKFVAHRGWSSKYPENTIPAFEAALNHPECGRLLTGIEIDIRLTKDNVMAVFHDDKLDVGGVKTPVEQIGYAELLRLTDVRFKGVKVPVLDEVFDCVGHRLELLVEIKDGGYDKKVLMDSLDASLKRYNPKGDVILHSFSPLLMQMAVDRFEGRGVRFGVLVGKVDDLSKFTPGLLAKMETIHPYWKGLLEEQDRYASYGKRFNVWTVDHPEALEALKKSKDAAMISAIMTDDLKLLESYR